MVRLSRGYEALLHPYVDSKGNFGKFYSRDMAWAASRYTEARLDPICRELFRDIDKDTVDLCPTTMHLHHRTDDAAGHLPDHSGQQHTGHCGRYGRSNICSFNLVELCNATIALMKDDQADLAQLMPAPDFVGGGSILYDAAEMQNVLEKPQGAWRS